MQDPYIELKIEENRVEKSFWNLLEMTSSMEEGWSIYIIPPIE